LAASMIHVHDPVLSLCVDVGTDAGQVLLLIKIGLLARLVRLGT
jgi:hypothetical protein